jgi:thymidine phosphorylase
VGNGLETAEAIEYLKGNPLPDTRLITEALVSRMLLSADLYSSEEEALKAIAEVVSNGKALAKLEEIIRAQNGDPRVVEDYCLLGTAVHRIPVLSAQGGYVHSIDSRAIGYALVKVKAGRMKVSDTLDYGAGALLDPKIGDQVSAGQAIGEVLANDLSAAEEAARAIAAAYAIAEFPKTPEELILGEM